MRKTWPVLAVLLFVVVSFPGLNAGNGELSSEANLTPGNTWTEWKEFLDSGVGTRFFWRFCFLDASRQAFAIQMDSKAESVVSFSGFTVCGGVTGKDIVWRGIQKPNRITTMKGTFASPYPQAPGNGSLIQVRLAGLVKGESAAGLTEEERNRIDSSPEVKDAKTAAQDQFQKYLQSLEKGNTQEQNQEVLRKYKDAKEAENQAINSALNGTGATDLNAPNPSDANPASSPAFDPNF